MKKQFIFAVCMVLSCALAAFPQQSPKRAKGKCCGGAARNTITIPPSKGPMTINFTTNVNIPESRPERTVVVQQPAPASQMQAQPALPMQKLLDAMNENNNLQRKRNEIAARSLQAEREQAYEAGRIAKNTGKLVWPARITAGATSASAILNGFMLGKLGAINGNIKEMKNQLGGIQNQLGGIQQAVQAQQAPLVQVTQAIGDISTVATSGSQSSAEANPKVSVDNHPTNTNTATAKSDPTTTVDNHPTNKVTGPTVDNHPTINNTGGNNKNNVHVVVHKGPANQNNAGDKINNHLNIHTGPKNHNSGGGNGKTGNGNGKAKGRN